VGFFGKLNPVNWFRKPARRQAPVAAPPTPVAVAPAVAVTDSRNAQTGQAQPSQAPLPPAPAPAPASGPAPRPAEPAQLPPPPGGHAPLEGFDHVKLANPNHKTPKYLFARVAQQFGLEKVRDTRSKAEAEALLNQMVPYMRVAGMEIAGVSGDKINVKTEIGWEWVDVVRGAGGGDPAYWWGSEGIGFPQPGIGLHGNGGGGHAPAPGGPGPGGPGGHAPGGELSTVPYNPRWANVRLDKSSPLAALLNAARYVKDNHPEFFDKGDDREVAYKMMTEVIGIMRANGFDAYRVVNHPSRPLGHPLRYGSDAVVLDGRVYDVWGDPGKSTPQTLDVGPADPGRPRE